MRKHLILTVLLMWVLGASAQFRNVTEEIGILHAHENPVLMGGGVDIADYNNDGWEDLFFTGGRTPDRMYINMGNWVFEENSFMIPSYRSESTISSGVISGDLNNDGCQDIVLATIDPNSENFVFRNNCDGSFSKVELPSSRNSVPCIGSALIDFDRDGLLDIYIIGYVENPRFIRDEDDRIIGYDHDCAPNFLYKNHGNFEFEEVSEEYGAAGHGCALAVGTTYLDDQELIYVANDFGEWIQPNELFYYDRDSFQFFEKSNQHGLDVGLYGMGIAPGDFDNDLDLDLYVTNLGANAFLQNEKSHFTDISLGLGVDNTYLSEGVFATSWGCFFFDCDNDSDLDLFVANGYIDAPQFLPTFFLDPNKLYIQTPNGFIDYSEPSKLDFEGINRGAAYGDLDLDGDLDVIVANLVQGGFNDRQELSFQVFENRFPGNNYLQIQLEGLTNSRDGFGSRILAYYCDGAYLQYLYSGGTYASQSSKAIHFGLGNCGQVDSIEVIWPNGLKDIIYDIPVNQKIRIRESEMDYKVLGCTDSLSVNYNPLADINSACLAGMTTDVYDEELKSFNVLIHPNPVRDRLWLDLESISDKLYFRIYNSSGIFLKGEKIGPGSQIPAHIDVNDLANGMYFIQFITEDSKILGVEKFVIQ